MKIPRYWARRVIDGVAAFGWSFSNDAEAEAMAQDRARDIAARLAAGTLRDRGKSYYADRPVREPIMREFRDSAGELSALITRNAYGALVLNAARALFVDVDFPEHSAGGKAGDAHGGRGGCLALLASLFGSRPAAQRRTAPPPPGPPPTDPLQPILERARAWTNGNPGWQWRIYRTKAGVRLLATHALFMPGDPQVQTVFEALGADPLYRKLCANQQCFRARLTPKPWRCGYRAPQTRWPFLNARAEAEYNDWEQEYLQHCGEWSTCELIEDHGPAHAELAPLVEFHDAATRVGSGLPLA
jgi:hypothetical protein